MDWELGPSDLFARYAFEVEVGVPLSDTERRQMWANVDYLKPAHTHFVDLIEPGLLGSQQASSTTHLFAHRRTLNGSR